MIIALASDHGGYELKIKVKHFLEQIGVLIEDFGPLWTGTVLPFGKR